MFNKDSRFIVIDDFSTMRKIVKKTLIEMGFSNVQEAEDGQVAWDHLQKAKAEGKPYHFIVSDWNMPNMQGLDLLKLCRKDDVYGKTPFVMVTAEGEQKQIIEAIKSGCTEYIVKPFAPNVIKEKITKIYEKFNIQNAA
jgi:two-component system, chemotaxis family, chemotaxis protein CheY